MLKGMDDGRVHIGLVLTGGTIGSIRSGGMVVIDLNDQSFAETALVEDSWVGPGKLQLHTRVPVRKLSEDMNQHDWLAIADAIRDLVEVEEVKDVLVFHGTDTAAYTAAALSFLLADLSATVVVTGANVPSPEQGSDAGQNVADALLAARLMSPGVYLSFSGIVGAPSQVFLGSTVRKMKAEGQAYEAPNLGPVARVQNREVEIVSSWPRLKNERRAHAMDNNVTAIYLHPGIDLEMYADALISTKKRGVVVRMYPCATAPDNVGPDSLSRFTQRLTAAGIVVVACLERYVPGASTYPSLAAIKKVGALFAADMIPEVAFVKLCWALGQTDTPANAEALFLEPLAGESLSAARVTEAS